MPPPPLILSVDKGRSSPTRPRSPFVTTPKSATIAVPSSWGFGESPGGGSSGRPSMDESRPGTSPGLEPPFPLSASSSSSSSNPIFVWPQATASTSSTPGVSYALPAQDRPDPFDTTSTFADDPFGQTSSSSDDGSRHNSFSQEDALNNAPTTRRRSVLGGHPNLRHASDPLMGDIPAIDQEFILNQRQDDYDFSTQPVPPSFHRTFSSPLPIVKSLRHPLSPSKDPIGSYCAHPPTFSSLGIAPSTSTSPSTAPSSNPVTPLQTLSLELADSLQSAIQTLLHLSPPHLLDNAKEQYSGCTVQMPSTSLSALLTSMRGLNYLSANVEALCEDMNKKSDDGLLAGMTNRTTEDFDIGELLQSVADLLGGQAAQGGVDFVLFHGDVGIKHVSVRGDGEGLGYALSHIIRQILLVANKGDTIELGLQIIPQSPSMTPRVPFPLTAADVEQQQKHRGDHDDSPGRMSSPSNENHEGPLLCSFEIVHNIYQPTDSLAGTPKAEFNPFTKLSEDREAATPKFDSLLTRRLLQHQNANFRVDIKPSSPMGSGNLRRAYEVSVLLPRGTPLVEPTQLSVEEEAIRQPFSTVRLAREPTLTELADFAESLRGRKAFLHASLQSVFARHLTSYLGAWGLDISHIAIEEDEYSQKYAEPLVIPSPYNGPSAVRGVEKFVIIDDDVAVLKQELLRLRVESPSLSSRPRLSKRPTLAGRTRSTPLVRQVSSMIQTRPNVILIHFTSLANYNQVRDVVSTFLGSPVATGGGSFLHPEVMVIPKPVGPRRFLTALHTAVSQPVVDPFFSPIATSPRSPGGGYFPSSRTPTGGEIGSGGFFDSVVEEQEEVPETTQKPRSPLGEYPPAQASIVRTDSGLHLSLPTPGDILATPASEYFSSASKSSGSGAAGVVMQSPDGRPFGMFFEPPRGDGNRRTSFKSPSEIGRRRSSRRTSTASTLPDDSGSTTSPHSPQSSRRTSGVSTVTDDVSTGSSRRGSGLRPSETAERPALPTMASTLPAVPRTNSRRKTLPVGIPPEPIIAKGRDRSSTVTRRQTPVGSPVISSPKPDGHDVAPPFNPPRGSKKTAVEAVTEAQSTKPGKKAGKEEVVVPPINVLIVEDNPINQNILSMFLRKKKIKHQSAKDGLEAVEKWRTGGFHLILMDIQLPVMDGIEATKEIRKLEKNNNIGIFPSTPAFEQSRLLTADSPAPASPFRSSVIIVALTASSLQSDRVSALAAGCNDFLTKPVSLKWLERKIVEWGCMQALIDFDGWRRWKGSDAKDTGETKRGFQVGPQQAAKTLAGRLKIERKSTRAPPTRSDSLPGPEINLLAPTPEPKAESASQNQSDQIVDQLSQMGIQDVKDGVKDNGTPPVTAIPPNKALPAINEDHETPSPKTGLTNQPLSADPIIGQIDKPLPALPTQ